MTASEQRWTHFEVQARAACEGLAQGLAALMVEIHGRETLPELRALALTLATTSEELGITEFARLASALERCFALLFDGHVDPGQALPLLASGTETLARSLRWLNPRAIAADPKTPLQAATYELETLFPAPGEASRQSKGGPDVSIDRLRSPSKSAD